MDKGRLFLKNWSAWPVLKRNQAAKFLKNFQVHFVLFSQENNVLKRELCISKH